MSHKSCHQQDRRIGAKERLQTQLVNMKKTNDKVFDKHIKRIEGEIKTLEERIR